MDGTENQFWLAGLAGVLVDLGDLFYGRLVLCLPTERKAYTFALTQGISSAHLNSSCLENVSSL